MLQEDKEDGTFLEESNIKGKNKYFELINRASTFLKSLSYLLLLSSDIGVVLLPSTRHRKLYSTETAGKRDVVSCFYPNKKNRQNRCWFHTL
jgi:hypothetical protein